MTRQSHRNAASKRRRTLESVGEEAFIRRLRASLPVGRNVVVGIGDDCAVVRPASACPHDLVLTSDPVIRGVHFASGAPAELVGRKAIGRVLSDIAAMGAEPLWALINLVAPASTSLDAATAMYRGAETLARQHGMTIVGGDTAEGKELELHVFAAGRVPRGTALLRSGARPGQFIYVTGELGGSLAGRHLTFEPRVAEGMWLRKHCLASAMTDLSDGMASDLRHIVEASDVGATINTERVPISRAARLAGGRQTALRHALCDGEDYELLFAVEPAKKKLLESRWAGCFGVRLSCIGVVTGHAGRIDYLDQRGRRVGTAPAGGYRHFARR